MKNRKYYIVRTVSKYNRKIVGRGDVHNPDTHIHYLSLSWLVTGTSVKGGGVKLVLGA